MRQKLSTIKNARWLFSIAFIFIYSIFVNLVFAQSVGNAGFESGALSPWSTWNPSGTSSVATGNSRTGTYSSYQSGGETSLEQVVSNLMPNTTYIFEGWIKTGSASQAVDIGVKNYGGNQVSQTCSGISYSKYQVSFTTGASNTQATIYVYKLVAGAAYGDDFNLFSVVKNNGFESGALSPWSAWNPSGNSSVATGNSRTGTYSSYQSGGETSLEQVVSNLMPNTTYIFEGWIKTGSASQTVNIGVKNYGGNQVSQACSDTTYSKYQVSFTTGASNTQATIYIYKPVTGTAYGDDFNLLPSTTYYVDNINGNDINSGRSPTQAWKSLTKVNATTFMPGDKVLFIYNGNWTGSLSPKGSGAAGNPIVIGRYGGTSSRPIFNGNGALRVVYLFNQQYIEIADLEVTNTANPGQKKRGIEVENVDRGKLSSIVIRNNYVHDVLGDNTKDADGSLGIIVVVRKGITPVLSWFDDVKIEGNIVKNVNRTGIGTASAWWCRASVGCSDGSGYAAHTNVVIRNNYVENAGGDGIVAINTVNGLIEYNMVNGANVNSGTANVGIWCWNGDNNVFQFNEVFNVKTTLDGQGFDVDYGQDGTIFQYNYSHDNEGGFILICTGNANGSTNSIVRYNISQNDKTRIFQFAGPIFNAQIYNNSFYLPSESTTKPIYVNSWNGYPVSAYMYNNVFQLTAAGAWDGWNLFTGTKAFDYNMIYGARTAGEPTGINNNLGINPQYVSAGSGTSGSLVNGIISFGSVNGYKINSGSAAIGTGKLISNNGGKDYWGNAVSSSTAPNRGAYNGPGEALTGAKLSYTQENIKRIVRGNMPISTMLYPSPAPNGSCVYLPYSSVSPENEVEFTIHNLGGKMLYNQKIGVTAGENLLKIQLPWLMSGLYIGTLSTRRDKVIHKIIIK